ncbi:acetyl-CoA carboxyl transferase [Rhodococcus sp. Leaf7]|uniref:carboxyl transferase domain-containing protein n=1 Tax=unclassified Rhodococcus (in: high G+C Gram-positive bacteria) TaxID=192944 RepID=UPI0006F24DB7|nr:MULTISPECIES: carboxyl transferase domain-containing protein [unclassified Rhodococcus (in: high G+C Gram-positive bacteria)]KQU06808.1 acetyl-CoA carboxyl transferase [Rhodococcus sp. Leaf7]KQU42327.1 acetyl-CoA carboxyl transferase [Rhodococcus sp. Leaf247]
MTTSAQQFLDAVLDPESFLSWDRAPLVVAADERYLADLKRARTRSGVDEAVLTGEGTVAGRRVAVVVCEFAFLAGSIGVAAAERITLAVERATAEELPLIASPTSGGTRMQEGTTAFVQMVTIAAAVTLHKNASLPYLVYLRHPTTGGVFASWGSLGHITLAEPGALIGFLGPRVYQALYGDDFPEGVQSAENLFRCGVIDAVVAPDDVRDVMERALVVLRDPAEPQDSGPEPQDAAGSAVSAWHSVLLSRRPERPGVRELLAANTSHHIPLSGTGRGDFDSTVTLSLARFRGRPCVVFGQDRTGQTPENTMGPGALREALRGMRLAEELGLPAILVIDTLGASLSREAEEHGLAPGIARCISTLITLRTPTVSVLLGQGTGGGALALLPADRVVAAQHAWLAPLPPEGASAIVYRDTAHAPAMAEAQGIRPVDLRGSGIVDTIVAEDPDAADEPSTFMDRLGRAITREMDAVTAMDPAARQAQRLRRFRNLGR